MEQLDLFGGETYEYLFVIEPDHKTSEKLMDLRMSVNRLVPLSEEVLNSKPHISICYFKANDFSDDHILTKAKQTLSSIEPFDIQLEGFEQWKHGTLVVKVDPSSNTSELQQQLSDAFRGVIKNLHLTIARNISSKFLDQISMENLAYSGEFTCESILILKKKGSKPYQVLDTIHLRRDTEKR